jgi:hypothetical protein
VLAFTVVRDYIYFRQCFNILSSELTFTIVCAYIYCRQSLHLLSSELTFTVIRAYISSHMKLATTSHYSNLRIFVLMHLQTIRAYVSFNVLLVWYSAISRNTSTEDWQTEWFQIYRVQYTAHKSQPSCVSASTKKVWRHVQFHINIYRKNKFPF